MSHTVPDPESTPLAQRLTRHPLRDRQGLPPAEQRSVAQDIESDPSGEQS